MGANMSIANGLCDLGAQMNFENAEKLLAERKFEDAFNKYMFVYNYCNSSVAQGSYRNISDMLHKPERLLFRIAAAYNYGGGVAKNINEAVRFYTMAADLGVIFHEHSPTCFSHPFHQARRSKFVC